MQPGSGHVTQRLFPPRSKADFELLKDITVGGRIQWLLRRSRSYLESKESNESCLARIRFWKAMHLGSKHQAFHPSVILYGEMG